VDGFAVRAEDTFGARGGSACRTEMGLWICGPAADRAWSRWMGRSL